MTNGLELKSRITEKLGFEKIKSTLEKIGKTDLSSNIKNKAKKLLNSINIILESKNKGKKINFNKIKLINNPEKINCNDINSLIVEIKNQLKGINLKEKEKELETTKEEMGKNVREYKNGKEILGDDKEKLEKEINQIKLLQEILNEINFYREQIKNRLDNKTNEVIQKEIIKPVITPESIKKIPVNINNEKKQPNNKEIQINHITQETKIFNSFSEFKTEYDKIENGNLTEKEFLETLNKEYTNLENKLKLEICYFLYEEKFINKDVLSNLFKKIKLSKKLPEELGNKWDIVFNYINRTEILNIKNLQKKEVKLFNILNHKKKIYKKPNFINNTIKELKDGDTEIMISIVINNFRGNYIACRILFEIIKKQNQLELLLNKSFLKSLNKHILNKYIDLFIDNNISGLNKFPIINKTINYLRNLKRKTEFQKNLLKKFDKVYSNNKEDNTISFSIKAKKNCSKPSLEELINIKKINSIEILQKFYNDNNDYFLNFSSKNDIKENLDYYIEYLNKLLFKYKELKANTFSKTKVENIEKELDKLYEIEENLNN